MPGGGDHWDLSSKLPPTENVSAVVNVVERASIQEIWQGGETICYFKEI